MPLPCCVDDSKWNASPLRRWVLYIFCFMTVAMVAGVVYGWPALRKQLQADGSTLDESTLGAIYTVGAWSTQGGRFFVGLARDRFGTKSVASTCIFIVALGSLGVAWSDPNNAPALGVSLFAMGVGSGAQLCVQPVAGLFPNTSGTVIATLSGAFQIAGLVFLALSSGDSVGTRKLRFSTFAILVMAIGVCAVLLLPKGKSFILEKSGDVQAEGESKDDNTATATKAREVSSTCHNIYDDSKGSSAAVDERSSTIAVMQEDSEVPYEEVEAKLHVMESAEATDPDVVSSEESASQASPPTTLEQLMSAEYIGLCIWFSVCLIPLQYYIGSIGFQLEEKGDDGFYTDLFSIVYASATVVSPAGGFLSDKLSLGITQGLATIMCAGSFFFLASDVSLKVQSVGLVLYGVGRLLIFGMYFANCGNRFGYTNFGTLAGLGLLVSALASLLQYPMISAAANGQSQAVNFGSGVALLSQIPYFVWLHRREKTIPGAKT